MGNAEAGGISGLMRELKITINELFSGGKLEPDQELTLQVLFGLLGYVANIDGIVTDHETTVINAQMDEMFLPIQARQRALDALAQGRKRLLNPFLELDRYLEVFPAATPQTRGLYDKLLKLAAADGRIRPQELEFLHEITVHLGYPVQDLEPMLGSLLAAAKAGPAN